MGGCERRGYVGGRRGVFFLQLSVLFQIHYLLS